MCFIIIDPKVVLYHLVVYCVCSLLFALCSLLFALCSLLFVVQVALAVNCNKYNLYNNLVQQPCTTTLYNNLPMALERYCSMALCPFVVLWKECVCVCVCVCVYIVCVYILHLLSSGTSGTSSSGTSSSGTSDAKQFNELLLPTWHLN